MAETITLNELKPGDIVLFSIPEHSWISSIIGFLTHSEVSHTAMVDMNPAFILEEGGKGAAQSPLPDPGTRKLYIRRLNNAPDTSKVDDIAMKYVKEKLPYPMSNLVFLGLYIIAGDFIPDTIAGDIIKNILRLATYELMKLVNNKTHPGTDVPPMVCSQFAAACYDEAALTYGPEYKIHYTEKVTTVTTLLRKIIDQLTEEESKMYSIEMPEHKSLLAEIEGDAAEFHCAKLKKHIESNAFTGNAERVSDEMIAVIYNFGKWFLRLFDGKTEYDAEPKYATTEDIKNVLEELLRFQEAFVTPGDLLTNTTNLDDMGILTYTAEELQYYKDQKDQSQ